MKKETSGGFSSSIGFVLSAAGSAVGVGNIWRFPYLAARDGGGLFILVYILLILTFGFTLLTTDIAIGRKTGEHAISAYKSMHPKWGFLGKLTFVVPAIIMTFYPIIGGWVTKYIVTYATGAGSAAADSSYFTGFITSHVSPIAYTLFFIAITAVIVYRGVEKGIEKFSTIVMPILFLMVVGIAIFSLTLTHTDASGETRTGLQGLAVYLIPNFEGLTLQRFLNILMDAMGQLFFSLSVSMGIMVTYGSYVKKETNLSKSISQIEFCDTFVALLAGMMLIPAVYVFMGLEGMESGAKLMFISLPKVFESMGAAGGIIGLIFCTMVAFAALTSCVSILETLVASCSKMFNTSREKMCIIISLLAAAGATIICLGYNVFYFEVNLPNGAMNQQMLDVFDYFANNVLMPLISLLSCILIGWVVKPNWIAEEMEKNGHKFSRKALYIVMIKYIAPVLMAILFVQSTGILNLFSK